MEVRGLYMRATDGPARSVDVVASTEAVDSYGTVLRGWDLERFKRSPVVLWNHDRSGLPIGRAENIRLEGGALRMTIRFVDAAANPLAELVYQGVRQGSIRGVSVGFAPSKDFKASDDVLDGLELLEVSLCPVPSNPEAVTDPATVRAGDVAALAEAARAFGMDVESFRKLVRPAARVSSSGDCAQVARAFGMDVASFRALVGKGDEVDGLMSTAMAAGKVTPAQRLAFLRACGADETGKGADPACLRALVEALPVRVRVDAPIKVEATEDAAALEQAARAFGVTEEAFRAFLEGGS